MSDFKIHGIPCTLRCAESRATVDAVLTRIKERFPDDYAVLLKVVEAIAPVPQEEVAAGTGGQWVRRDFATMEEERGWFAGHELPVDLTRRPGTVLVLDSPAGTAGLVAHELGHAFTTDDDIHDRGECPSEDWASELAADYHACRWGFAADIAADRPTRDWMHHCAAPGDRIDCQEENGLWLRYEVGHDYVMRLVPGAPPQDATECGTPQP